MKKLNELVNKIKKESKSAVYSIPGWDKSITEYSAEFISGKDPKVKKVKNEKTNNQ